MKFLRQLGLTAKLIFVITVCGLAPAGVVGWKAISTADQMGDDVARTFQDTAVSLIDKVERNLFERYGDVQAFGANGILLDKASRYQVGSAANKIAAAANRYANLYGFYALSLVVDLEGKVIAVNDADAAGKPIDTKFIYEKNYRDAVWFKEVSAGRFLKSDVVDGTFVQDLYSDDDMKKVYGGDGLVLGFTAPIKDADGKVIAIWNNRAVFALVEEIFNDTYRELAAKGFTQAELTLLDRTGRVLVDYDPATSGTQSAKHDPAVLLNLNLAEHGVGAAQQLVAGKSGFGRDLHTRKKIWQSTGYAASKGALGYPGLKWGVLVRVPESQALAAAHSQRRSLIAILGLSMAALLATGWWLARSIARPILLGMQAMQQASQQVAAASGQLSASSQSLADGASEQAASIEQTSASLEEMSSMTVRNAESARAAKDLATQTRQAADGGSEALREMSVAISAIKTSGHEMRASVQAIQSASVEVSKIVRSIDEIAFQTNILALNAAVEAARAGEAGMGFAVVADEVRNLAQRSARAAKESSEKIDDSIRKSQLGVEVSVKLVQSVEGVETQSRHVEQSFTGIVAKARQVDEVVAHIATACTEQSQGIKQVNLAVSAMDKVTQNNAASAEEGASAADQLNAQARGLSATVAELRREVAGGEPTDVAGASQRPPATLPAKARAVAASRVWTAPSVSTPPASTSSADVFAMPAPDPARLALPTDKDFRDF